MSEIRKVFINQAEMRSLVERTPQDTDAAYLLLPITEEGGVGGFTSDQLAVLDERLALMWADCNFEERSCTPAEAFTGMGGDILHELAASCAALLRAAREGEQSSGEEDHG